MTEMQMYVEQTYCHLAVVNSLCGSCWTVMQQYKVCQEQFLTHKAYYPWLKAFCCTWLTYGWCVPDYPLIT